MSLGFWSSTEENAFMVNTAQCTWTWGPTDQSHLLWWPGRTPGAQMRATCGVFMLVISLSVFFSFLVIYFSIVAAIWRRTAVCVLSTLTSDRIWAGNGSMNLRATMPTSAQAHAHTSAAQTQPTARYGTGSCLMGCWGWADQATCLKRMHDGLHVKWVDGWWSGV